MKAANLPNFDAGESSNLDEAAKRTSNDLQLQAYLKAQQQLAQQLQNSPLQHFCNLIQE